MPAHEFVHLHLHSEYSLLDGMNRLPNLCERVKALEMPAVALTDHGNMFGALDFQRCAQDAGVKPIFGCEVYLTLGSRHDRDKSDRRYHTGLLCQNLTGYKNLCKMVSIAFTEGFYHKPRIDLDLLERHSEGLICFSGCLQGPIPQRILAGYNDQELDAMVDRFVQMFGRDNYFIELMNHGLDEQKQVTPKLLELAERHNLGLVATNDSHYLCEGDDAPHDILLCIGTGNVVHDENRLRYDSDQFYLKSPEQMAKVFGELPRSMANTLKIAEMCECEIPLGQQLYPKSMDVPEGQTPETYLRGIALEGLAERLGGAIPEEYQKRLDYELGVIHKTGFDDYFLIVSDFIHYAVEQGIPVGPGRGSGAGSVAAWALKITDLNPVEHGLFFERFLNPDRVSPPDFDIDFCINRRGEVINYVRNKYGPQNVAQIVTFGTLKAKAAVRDVGRALDVPLADVNKVAKMIPEGPKVNLAGALEESPDLKQAYEKDDPPRTRELIDTARQFEGLHRNTGIHAAGVVITDVPLHELCPVFKTPDSDEIITQLEMKNVEALGLLKMDFLGLKNLTVIDSAEQMIEQLHGLKIDWPEIGFEDEKTYQLIAQGQTLGVFQLESAGMRGVCKSLKPTCFSDVAAVIALYRPGPMQFIETFVQNKYNPRNIQYLHPELEPILAETYGIIVYQEQVMQISNKLAGFTLAEGDILRKAMGKKKADLMEELRVQFIDGCVKNEIDKRVAEEIWRQMAMFAEYGFNKSHTVAYTVVSYRTAWLKAHYPVEFMASLITHDMGNLDKMPLYFQECRDMGVSVLPIDVNKSFATFMPEEGDLRFGMAAIKNVGRSAIDAIIAEREANGPFASFIDFAARVESKALNTRMVEALIKVGAFDSLPHHRAQLLAVVDEALEMAAQYRENFGDGQGSLFDDLDADEGGGNPLDSYEVPKARKWSMKDCLAAEKDFTGYYMSGHPLDDYRADIAAFADCDALLLKRHAEGRQVAYIGIVNAIISRVDRNGNKFVFMEMEDLTGTVEVTVFSSLYAKVSEAIEKGAILAVLGRVDEFNDLKKITADDVRPVEEARAASITGVELRLELSEVTPKLVRALDGIVVAHPGETPFRFRVSHPESGFVVVQRDHPWRVEPSQEFIQKIQALNLRRPMAYTGKLSVREEVKRKRNGTWNG